MMLLPYIYIVLVNITNYNIITYILKGSLYYQETSIMKKTSILCVLYDFKNIKLCLQDEKKNV